MSWDLSDKERVIASSLPPAERYGYFVSQVATWGEVWGLRSEGGWAVTDTDLKAEGGEDEEAMRQALLVWPHRRLAEACIPTVGEDNHAERIPLAQWLGRWLPGMARDGLLVGVFPTSTRRPVVVEPEDHRSDLVEEGLPEGAAPSDARTGDGGWPAIPIQREPSARRKQALLVVDVLAGIFELPEPLHAPDTFLDAVDRAVTRARAAGWSVVFVQGHGAPGSPVAADTPGGAIHPRLAPAPGELRVPKHHPDAFHDTFLEAWLRERRITDLYVAGFASDHCVDATVRSGYGRGFHMHLVQDAHTTTANGVLSAAQIVAHHTHTLSRYATLVTAEELRSGAKRG